MLNKTVYNFAKHCMQSEEFNYGGIPEKEDYYLKKLGWKPGDENCNRFYEAIAELWRLAKGE